MSSQWRLASLFGSDGTNQRDIGFSVGIVLLAAAARLFVALNFASEPVWDGHYYHFGAVRLAAGLGYSEDVNRLGISVWKPWTHYPVGYSFWLSLWYRLFGGHRWVAPLSNVVVGALTVLAVHRIALPWLGIWRARLAAALTACHPGLVLYTAVVMSEPLAAMLLLVSLWVLQIERPRRLGLVLSGALLGASVLVRPSSLVALPLYWFMLDGTWRRRMMGCVALAAVCFATILPWTLRNCRRMDGCALVSTNAGWNLAIGALTDNGRFRPLRAADGCPVVTGQVQQDRCWMQRGWEEIRRDPGRWLGLAPQKLAQTFDHESFAVEYLREANPRAWPEPRRVAWRERLTDAHRWLTVLAAFSVIGIVVGRRFYQRVAFYVQLAVGLGMASLAIVVFGHDEHPLYWLILAMVGVWTLPLPGRPCQSGLVGFSVGFVGLTALTHVMFFGDDRYHLVVSPLLCLLVAAALRSVSWVTEMLQRQGPMSSDSALAPSSVPRSS